METEYLCISCRKNVTSRQHAICCDGCEQWQHRTCDTGISLLDYRRMCRGQLTLFWQCLDCRDTGTSLDIGVIDSRKNTGAAIDEVSTTRLPHLPPPTSPIRRLSKTTFATRPADCGSQTVPATITMTATTTTTIDGERSLPTITAAMSILNVNKMSGLLKTNESAVPAPNTDPRLDPSPPAEDSSQLDPEDTSCLDLSFDISRTEFDQRQGNEAGDGSNDEYILNARPFQHTTQDNRGPIQKASGKFFLDSASDDEDDVDVNDIDVTTPLFDILLTYEVVATGSARGRDQLVSSHGYTYCVKQRRGDKTYWRCTKRNRNFTCSASVLQKGSEFTPGCLNHPHLPAFAVLIQLRLIMKLKQEAILQLNQPAPVLVDHVIEEMAPRGTWSYFRDQRQNLIRAVNRHRRARILAEASKHK